jgi:hypothetical protein
LSKKYTEELTGKDYEPGTSCVSEDRLLLMLSLFVDVVVDVVVVEL